MIKRKSFCCLILGIILSFDAPVAAQQQAGSIRGVVRDKDFDAPLAAAQVLIVETGQKVATSDQGNYVLSQVPPGKYTLVFSKEGYVRQVKSDVVVSAGRLTDVDISLSGDFTEMDEYVVKDILRLAAGTEAALLKLRLESPSLMDSISADLISRAGASDAAGALKLVTGATVKDGKFAVIRGLPDRYVSTQLNSVRLPSADEDTRAVELDQYPSAVIESVQVSKTFTPDQQGDASGGAVNVVLKGIPDEPMFFQFKSQYGYNSNVRGRSDFLTYDGGGVNFWGKDDGGRDVQWERLDGNWEGAAGTSTQSAPTDYKWSWAAGGKHEFENGLKVGGLVNFFYERDSSYFDDGIDDSYWILGPGEPLTPRYTQGAPPPPGQGEGNFKTSLFDVTQGKQSVQWGGLVTGGLEYEKHSVNMAYLFTRTTEDSATLTTDTRGKKYWFPDYDPNDSMGPGNQEEEWAPYLRLETLEYTEREIETLMFNGEHELPTGEFGFGDVITFEDPKFDWTFSNSTASLNQPDKRLFSALWHSAKYNPGSPWEPPSTDPPEWFPFKPSANFNLGFFQRIWKEIEEESNQYSMNLKLPFKQWGGEEGYLKFGLFDDRVDREFDQNTFSNLEDNSSYQGGWNDPWSKVFPNEDHPIKESDRDVDYKGDQDIFAWYSMMDLPLASSLNVIAGVRWEYTDISVGIIPEENATWFPKGSSTDVKLNPGDADVDFSQDDALPSIGLVYSPVERVTLRGSYSETIARQTFKELTPVMQQEYLGAPIFIGNPELKMASLRNYDLRMDYEPYEGGLVSFSYFLKDVDDPIEYVQRVASLFDYTTAENYPEGELKGWEMEVRQHMGEFWDPLEGLALGGNATFIDSEVKLPADEAATFMHPNILSPRSKRDATGAPSHLYNLYTTYDLEATGTQFGLFYTVTGDTLVAGAGASSGNLVPDVYAKEYDTLNLTVTQKLGEYITLGFKAKNLTTPKIQTEYRPKAGGDMLRTSHSTGVDYSITFSVKFKF